VNTTLYDYKIHSKCVLQFFIGALENDYTDNDVINCEPEQTEEVTEEDKQLPKDKKSDVEIGKIVFVSCAAGSEETYLDDSHKADEQLSDINSDKVDDGNYLIVLKTAFIF